MAINGTTVGVVLTKMSDMAKGDVSAFKRSRKAMHQSQVEQLFLIGIAVVSLVLLDSDAVKTNHAWALFWIQSIIIGVLFYGIVVLYDTAKSVFVLMDNQKGS
jgi:fumarate reductase subunit D